jgi:hypothetical protein
MMNPLSGNTLKGKYYSTVDFLFDWFGISCMTTEIFVVVLTNPNQYNRSTVQ